MLKNQDNIVVNGTHYTKLWLWLYSETPFERALCLLIQNALKLGVPSQMECHGRFNQK